MPSETDTSNDTKLDDAYQDIKVRLARIEERLHHGISKDDLHGRSANLHKAFNDQTWRMIAATVCMAALFATIAFSLARVIQ
jgi:anti-sigma-K factor RskA